MQSIVVFCGSSEGNDPRILESAYQLGSVMAQKKITLVYGGAKVGVMGMLANGSLENNGKVVGVIPEFLKKKEVVHTNLSELITTENMHERKLIMNDLSEGVIALPGGFGTLEELFEMVTWGQLGLHQKPIGILNIGGFYDELLKMLQKMVARGFLKQENLDMILVEGKIEPLLTRMARYQPEPVVKWIKKDQL